MNASSRCKVAEFVFRLLSVLNNDRRRSTLFSISVLWEPHIEFFVELSKTLSSQEGRFLSSKIEDGKTPRTCPRSRKKDMGYPSTKNYLRLPIGRDDIEKNLVGRHIVVSILTRLSAWRLIPQHSSPMSISTNKVCRSSMDPPLATVRKLLLMES